MEFVVGFTVVYVTFWVMSLRAEHQSKPAKNYQQLIKRDAFKINHITDE